MDYEKKIREIINSNSEYYPSEDKAVFAKYFPELIESKDEMIKQCLIEHIKCNKDLNWSLFQWFKPDTIIAWLEKQKVTDEEMIFRPIAGTDIRIAAKQALEKIDIGKKVVLAFNGAYIPVNGKTVGEIDSEYDAWLEKQGGKKPVDKVEPKFKVGDKVTIKGDNTVYTIGIIAPDKTCWLTHESRAYGWATFGILKHYVE